MQVPPIKVFDGIEWELEKSSDVCRVLGMVGYECMNDIINKNMQKANDCEDYTLCGSLCTVADVMVREVVLPRLEIDNIIEFGHCGAYSVTEAPVLFLSRKLPAVYAYSKQKGFELLRGYVAASDINRAHMFDCI